MSKRSRDRILSLLIIGASAVLFTGALVYTLVQDPTERFTLAEPGLDGRPAGRTGTVARTAIGSWYRLFSVGSEKASAGTAWPRFRGEAFDNTLAASSMNPSFGDLSRVKVLWSRKVGEGHAGAAVYGSRVYLLDYDENASRDLLRCFDLETGEEYWQCGYPHPLKRNHGLSRSIPSVNERYAVSIGPEGHVMCVDRDTGKFLWGIDLANDWKSAVPFWYTAQCPLLDGDAVILAPGSPDALVAAFDIATGRLLWQTPNPGGWTMSHSSIMKAMIGGTEQYLYAAVGGISGIDARTGALLWQAPWKANVVAPSPVAVGNRIFQTAGYGAGSIVLEIVREGEAWTAVKTAEYPPSRGLACEQQTPVASGGVLYGILPNDGGLQRNRLVCAGPDGKILWSSGKDLRFGLGPFLLVRDRLFVMDDTGTLSLLQVSADGCTLLDTFPVIPGGIDSWGPMAITGDGYLVARDSTTLVCCSLGWEE